MNINFTKVAISSTLNTSSFAENLVSSAYLSSKNLGYQPSRATKLLTASGMYSLSLK